MGTIQRILIVSASGIAAAAFLYASPAVAATPRIVNGLNTHGFPTTGALLHNSSAPITPTTAGSWCSGTLIGCSTFLTAAHCVEDTTAANRYWVYLQHGGIHTVSSVTMHPGYNGASGNDVAIIKLSSPVEGIDPTTLNTTHDLDAMGVGLPGESPVSGRRPASATTTASSGTAKSSPPTATPELPTAKATIASSAGTTPIPSARRARIRTRATATRAARCS